MSIIPEEEFKGFNGINLAPMVDFLFLVVAVFATLAVTKTALYDKEIQLVKITPPSEKAAGADAPSMYVIHLSVNQEGKYKWLTEFNEYLISSTQGIQDELSRQQNLGLLPQEKERTKILLHIDKRAQWQPISEVIFSVKEAGFDIHPVYDVEE